MDFVIQWVWYLLAFLVGSLVAWVIAAVCDQARPARRPVCDLARGLASA